MQPLERLWLGQMEYEAAWLLQRELALARACGQINDVVLLVEHPPVFTMGRNGSDDHLPGGVAALRRRGAQFVEVDRGGSVTFHGPGQLVAYPILSIAEAFPLAGHPGHGDVLAHVRALETAIIATVSRHGVVATRRPPYTGVWVDNAKLAAIGVKLASGVTTHGAALNVATDLSWFSEVVPCGIPDAGVTSLAALGVDPLPGLRQLGDSLAADFGQIMGRELAPPDAAVRALLTKLDKTPSQTLSSLTTIRDQKR